MNAPRHTDVVVVGGGTAGAAAAWQCARRGLRVVLVERRALGAAGARWVNGVALWQLDEADVPRPAAPELRGDAGPFHLVAGWGPERVVVTEHGVVDCDMRALVARLHALARDEGAELLDEAETRDFDGRTLRTSRGDLTADVFVDASGLGGARLMDVPAVDRRHVCAAAQAVHDVKDRAAARAFFERHRVPEGEVLCFSGVAGGYSIVNVRLHGDEVSLLTGSVPAAGHPSGKALLDGFVNEHAWIGRERFGGARAIPIRRPLDRLAHERVALLGDAACQVFPAHGSGIAQGLLAAKTLAETVASGGRPLDYAVRWQRRYGGLLAAYDVFRRFSQDLHVDEVRDLVVSGVMDPATSAAGMAQRWPVPDPSAAAGKVAALASHPMLATRLVSALTRMGTAAALYRAYPRSTGRRLRAFSRAAATVFGDRPDVA